MRGSFTINTAISDGESIQVESAPVNLTVDNVAPTIDEQTITGMVVNRLATQRFPFNDPGSDAWTYSVDYGVGSALPNELNVPITIGANGQSIDLPIQYMSTGIKSLVLTIHDGTASVSRTFTFNVAANTAPVVVAPIPNLLVEPQTTDRPFYANLRQVFGDNEDLSSELVFAVQGNTNAALVTPTIDINGILHLDISNNPAGAATVTIRTTDTAGAFVDAVFTIVASNSAPIDISLNQNAVLENTSTSAADLLFGQLGTVDADPADTHTYDLVTGAGDTDNARFRVVGDKIYIKQGETIDFETRPNYGVRVRSTDSGGLNFVKQLTLNVTDVNESVVLTRANASVTGNAMTQLINTGTWSDPESGAVTLSASLGTVTKNANGSWSWSYTPSVAVSGQVVTITANDGTNVSTTTFNITVHTTIATRGLVYVGATGASASTSLATDKQALLPGQSSTFANYTNYSRGLNGIVIDVAGLPASVTNAQLASSLQFANWNGISAAGFVALPSAAVPTVTIVAGGVAGSTRVRVAFPDNTLQNTWLRVTFLANANTRLAANDVFYFGNVIGELDFGNTATRLRVNGQDAALMLANQSPGANSASVTNKFDLDRNGRVNGQDYAILLANQQAAGIVAPITAPSARAAPASRGLSGATGGGNAAPLPSPAAPTKLTRDADYQMEFQKLEAGKGDSFLQSANGPGRNIPNGDAAGDLSGTTEGSRQKTKEGEEESLESLDSIFASFWFV